MKSLRWLLILFFACCIIGGYCFWQYNKNKDKTPTCTDSIDYKSLDEKHDTIAVTDTIIESVSKKKQKSSSEINRTNHSPSSYYNDEEDDDDEYCEGGKYDPAKYHTDYSKDQESRRRRYIDNDGFDEDDGYDEYRGYEHEDERSSQWDD